MTRYYAEEPCEHGQLNHHWNARDDGRHYTVDQCPGGSRRELTDVEIQEAEITPAGCVEDYWSLNVDELGGPGRYAIIPLPPEADE